MITISDGKLTIPEGQRFIGFSGDNRHTLKKFFIRGNTQSGWIYRLYLTFDDGTHNYFVLDASVGDDGTWLTWNIEESHIFKSGLVKAQIKAFSSDNEVYHTTSDVFVAGKSTEEDEEFSKENSEFLLYEKTLNDLYRKMQTASAKMPYVGTDGNWYTYDTNTETYINSGVNAYVPISEGGITPQLLDRSYWQSFVRTPVNDYSTLDDILSNEDAVSSVFRLVFSGLSSIYSVVGSGEFLGMTSYDGQKMLIVNLVNSDRWLFEKGSTELVRIELDEESVADKAITPSKLDREYWRYQSASFTESANDILACLTDTSSIQRFKALEDSSLYQQVGNHDLLGVKTTDSNCAVIDLQNFKRYRVEAMGNILVEVEPDFPDAINRCTFLTTDEFSLQYFKDNTWYEIYASGEVAKLFGQTGSAENYLLCYCWYDYEIPGSPVKYLEVYNLSEDCRGVFNLNTSIYTAKNSGKIINAGTFHLLTDLQAYEFTAGNWYYFVTSADLGSHSCLGRYYLKGGAGTDDNTYPTIEFVDFKSGRTGCLDITTGEITYSEVLAVDTELNADSGNAVSNSAVTAAINSINSTLSGLEELLADI